MLAFLPMSNTKKMYICTTRIEVVRLDKEPDTAHITGVRTNIDSFLQEIMKRFNSGSHAFEGFSMEWYVDKAEVQIITGINDVSICSGGKEAWWVSLATLTKQGVVWNKSHPIYETHVLPIIK